ncbi:MAG: NADH-quinone oxidoreductase subunit L [Truepera sp.]|nr:NADH-quinone oxidoreductase subunit L [Truepera sp.]
MSGELAALAPLVALAGATINALFGRSLREPLPGVIATLAVAVCFLLTLFALFTLPGTGVAVELWPYLAAGGFDLSLGFVIDRLSLLLMLVITGVGLLIHLYSIGYMHRDEGFSRYFAGLNLFVAAMLVLVLADSFLLMFIGWEGVGICSYLLVGFWYRERANADAARKAFIVNRIGDAGFLLAMFLLIRSFGTLNIAAVNEAATGVGSGILVATGLLLLLAAAGKSAQLPLQVWLPDAMAGPTPVSALIHAATMVTAGVYLLIRAAPLLAEATAASAVVAWVGALTALIAAFAAFAQTDIKKILAFSTISQLGYMFAAVGAGAYWVAGFHLFTHAFFKALLFLGAGSVIHALGGEQDIRRMGGLGRRLRLTGTTSLIATLALAGVPLFAGFFSKDAILSYTLRSDLLAGRGALAIYLILLLSAALTACYIFRWYHGIFAGKREARPEVRESPAVMTLPLVILAACSVGAGYVGLPEFALPNAIAPWLEPVTGAAASFAHPALALEWLMTLLALVAAALGLGVGYWVYALRQGRPARRLGESALARLSRSGVGFDALYRALLIRPGERLAAGLRQLDRSLVDQGLSTGFGALGLLGRAVRLLQSGYVRGYALAMLLGVGVLAVIVALGLWP